MTPSSRGVCVVLLLVAGCYDNSCDDAQQAIALRTLECTGDWSLAQGRGRWLEAVPNTCADEEARDTRCADAIGALSCKEVEALGDDIQGWLDVDPACDGVFSLVEAGDETAGGGGVVSLAPTCDCPTDVGAEVTVSFINETDLDLQLHQMLVDDCTLKQTPFTLLANGIGDLPLSEGVPYHMIPRGGDDLGCFVAADGLTVRVDLPP